MPDNSLIQSAALAQRTAQLEQQLRRFFGVLSRVPLARWQWLITFLLVLWLSHSVARLFWLIIPGPVIPPATVTSVAAVAPGASQATGGAAINIAQVKNLAPFGETNAEPVAPVEAQPVAATQGIENNAADTQLNLVLRGVLSSNDEKAARAIIVAGDKADVYGVGDALPVGNNVTLAKVLDLRVIINNNGSFESLWMYKDDPNAPKLGAAVAAPAPAAAGGYGNPPYQQQPPVFAGGSPRFESPSPAVAGDAGMAQMGKTLADVVAMSIYRENGQVVGYKIRPGRNAQLFNEAGLQADDIVTAVNGVPLSSPGKIMEIYKSMGSATSANLEIRRGGNTINLDVKL